MFLESTHKLIVCYAQVYGANIYSTDLENLNFLLSGSGKWSNYDPDTPCVNKLSITALPWDFFLWKPQNLFSYSLFFSLLGIVSNLPMSENRNGCQEFNTQGPSCPVGLDLNPNLFSGQIPLSIWKPFEEYIMLNSKKLWNEGCKLLLVQDFSTA